MFADNITIPGINIEEGVRRFANKRELYFKSLLSFVSGLPDSFEDFSSFASESKKDENEKYVHTLKGVSGNLSMTAMYEKTVALEHSLREGTLLESEYAQWTELIINIKHEVLKTLSGAGAGVGSKKGSHAEAVRLLTSLKEAFSMYNASKCDEIIHKLKSSDWENIDKAFLDTIYKMADSYDYDTAIAQINARIN